MSREMKTDHKSHKFDNLGPRTVVRLLKDYGIHDDDPRVKPPRVAPNKGPPECSVADMTWRGACTAGIKRYHR